MADFRIVIQTDTSKANRDMKAVGRNLTRVESTADRVRKAVRNAFAVTGILLLVRKLVLLVDTYTSVQNRLRIVTNNTQELTSATNALFDIARNTRSSFKATAELYTRTALVTRKLGIQQKQLAQFTESVNKAVIISGAAYIEAHQGIIQLSQGIASGILRGDELRSVLEQLPVVAEVLAKELGVTRGELRKLGSEGKITAEVILSAFKNAREELDELFAKTIPTISQAFTVLETDLIQSISVMNNATGASEKFARAILFLSTHLQELSIVLVSAAAGTATYFAGIKLGILSDYITKLFAFSKAVRAGNLVVIASAEANRQQAVATAAAAKQDLIAADAALVRVSAETAKAIVVRGNTEAEFARIAVNKQLVALEAQRTTSLAAFTAANLSAAKATRATNTVSGKLAARFPLLTAGANKAKEALGKLGGVAKAHPLLAVAAAVAAITTALVLMSDKIVVQNVAISKSIDLSKVKGKELEREIEKVAAGMDITLSNLAGATAQHFANATQDIRGAFGLMFDDIATWAKETFGVILPDSFVSVLLAVAKVVDIVLGFFRGMRMGIVALFTNLGDVIAEVMINAVNAALRLINAQIEGIVTTLNRLREKVGLDRIEMDFTLDLVDNEFLGSAKAAGEAINDAFWEGFNQTPITDTLERILSRAKFLAKQVPEVERIPAEKKKGAGKGKGTLDAFLQGLIQEIFLLEQTNKQRQIEDALLKAAAANKKALNVEQKDFVRFLIEETQALTDRNAVTEYLDDLNQEIFLLKTDASQREIRAQLLDLETSLIGGLTEETTKLAEAKLREADAARDENEISSAVKALQQENRVLSAAAKHRAAMTATMAIEEKINRKLNATERSSIAILSTLNAELAAQEALLDELGLVVNEVASEQDLLTGAWKRGAITLEQYNDQLERLRIESLMAEDSLRGGVVKAVIELDRQIGSTSNIVGETLTGAIGKASDAMVNFAQEGSFAFKKLFRDIFAELLRLSTQRLFVNILLGAGRLFGGGGGIPGFANGGSFNVGGSGGTDSQLVAFRATPGERVDVSTSGQQMQQAPAAAAPPQITLINVTDPAEALQVLDSSDGKQIIMNTIESNPATVRKLLRLQ